MKTSMKAALLSAFIFPGMGHFLLKKYILATALAGTAFAALYFLITKTVEMALQISDKILSGEVPLDFVTIRELISIQATGTDAQGLNIATVVIVICWLISIIDSYRAGRRQDKDTTITS